MSNVITNHQRLTTSQVVLINICLRSLFLVGIILIAVVLLEDNSVLPHYLDNTVIHSIITAFLILNTSVDKLLLLGICNC